MLSGQWLEDVTARIQDLLGDTRARLMRRPSLARNAFRRIASDLAVNYDRSPIVQHANGPVDLLTGRDGFVSDMGLWPTMSAMQRDLIGLREAWVRIEWSQDLARPVVRVVTPDCIDDCRPHPADPAVPLEVRELRWIPVPGLGWRWVWDHMSIADSARPFHRFTIADATDSDVTEAVLGRPAIDYPWRWMAGSRAGQPYLPGVMYHAARPVQWDWTEGAEVVEGTLDVATAYTFLQHVILRASWPKPLLIDLEPMGAQGVEGPMPRRHLVADPMIAHHFRTREAEPGAGARTGQLINLPHPDPESLARTVAMLERAVSDFDGLGLSAANLLRDSSNPWSAAALSITRDDKRRAQAKYGPFLARGDRELLAKIGAVTNAAVQRIVLPEDGWHIEYQSVPLGRDEADALRTHHGELIAAGRMSVIDAYVAEHPGTTRDEAEQALKRIREENARFAQTPGTQPTPIVQTPAAP